MDAWASDVHYIVMVGPWLIRCCRWVRENLGDRPEVRDALVFGTGVSERHNVAAGDEVFYVAVPFGPLGARWRVADSFDIVGDGCCGERVMLTFR